MKKRILISLCAILLLGILLGLLQALLVPKYRSNPEGALIGEYYPHAGGHDVIFVGDCEVYEGFVPAVLWEEYGISSYVRGSPQQLVWQSYYLLEETLRYETPEAVVFNVLALKYGVPQNEAFNRMTLDGMKWSETKLDAIKASMTEEESMVDYLFPLLRYHSRITELTGEDFRYAFGNAPSVSDGGYLMQTGIVPMTEEGGQAPGLLDYTLPKTAMEYLDRMRVLCEEKGIELILVKSPTDSWAYHWYDEWDRQVCEYAEEHGLAYYNLIDDAETMGIDWSVDTYDAGVHLNVYGAEKLTRYFGEILAKDHAIPDRRGESDTAAVWQRRVEAYYDRKTAMESRE